MTLIEFPDKSDLLVEQGRFLKFLLKCYSTSKSGKDAFVGYHGVTNQILHWLFSGAPESKLSEHQKLFKDVSPDEFNDLLTIYKRENIEIEDPDRNDVFKKANRKEDTLKGILDGFQPKLRDTFGKLEPDQMLLFSQKQPASQPSNPKLSNPKSLDPNDNPSDSKADREESDNRGLYGAIKYDRRRNELDDDEDDLNNY